MNNLIIECIDCDITNLTNIFLKFSAIMAFTPWFRSPFTDLTGSIVSHQWFGTCADLEMKVVDCFEAYGLTRGKEKCSTIINDFKECVSREKRNKRAIAMIDERDRQYSDGERSKENLYVPPPPIDSL